MPATRGNDGTRLGMIPPAPSRQSSLAVGVGGAPEGVRADSKMIPLPDWQSGDPTIGGNAFFAQVANHTPFHTAAVASQIA